MPWLTNGTRLFNKYLRRTTVCQAVTQAQDWDLSLLMPELMLFFLCQESW